MEKSSSNRTLLPNHKNLSSCVLGFLDTNFPIHDDNIASLSSTASNLEMELNQKCEILEIDLVNLKGKLGKLIVSWIWRSIAAKSALHKLNLFIHNMSKQCGVSNDKMVKMIRDDLSPLVKELQKLDNIRNYSETTLKLEALVGDFEDSVLFLMKRNTGNIFSTNLLKAAISSGFEPRQNQLFQAVKAANVIENLLVAEIDRKWVRLIKSVDYRVDKSLPGLRTQIIADHRAVLASLGWPPKVLTSKIENGAVSSLPNPLVLMQIDKRKVYSESFLVLCALQHLQVNRENRRNIMFKNKKQSNPSLWAIDELVSPIASRVEHHFSRWVFDQPELIFTLVYKITRDFVVGIDDILQPLIDKARLGCYSARESWVYAMVKMVSGFLTKRVFSVFAQKYKEKQNQSAVMLSWIHMIDLIIAFDKQMQSLISAENSFFEDSKVSLLSLFGDRPDWLKIWAKIELKQAWKKIKEESKHDRAWLIDNKKQQTEELYTMEEYNNNSPLIVESALKIAWEMIAKCQNLPNAVLRSQFIKSTSVRLIWHFFNFMASRCKAMDYDNDEFLITTCISINAARYCESKLIQWSDDSNYLFDDDIKSLSELETSWIMEVIGVLLRRFETLSCDYVQNKEHFEKTREHFDVSFDFVESLDAVRTQLDVIKKNLNSKDFVDLWRSVADGLDHFILRSILMSDDVRFSDDGIRQILADVEALFLVFQPFCFRPDAFFPCLKDSIKLLKISKQEARHLWLVLYDGENKQKQLTSLGISHISSDQAQKILMNRRALA